MKACKTCKHGHNYCDTNGLCTYCYINWLRKYPERKEQNYCCPDWEPDEEDEEDCE